MLRESVVRRLAKWSVRPCQTRMASCPALSPFLFTPILLCFPLHCRSRRVLHLEPIGRATGTVGGIPTLRHDTFKPHLAGMGEDGRTVALHVFVEPNARCGLGHDRCERGLADLKRITPQIVAVQFDTVEGV